MKHILAITLAFMTLATAAIPIPAAVADEKIDTTLMFVLNQDGSSDDFIIVYSNDGTVNTSNCKDGKRYTARFSQVEGRNKCIFARHNGKNDLTSTWYKQQGENDINFTFSNTPNYSLELAKKALGINYSTPLKINNLVVVVPANANISEQTLLPELEKSSKHIYCTWRASAASNPDAGLKGKMPFPNSSIKPTSEPTNTTIPTATDDDSLHTVSATSLSKDNGSDIEFYIALAIVCTSALIGIATIVLIAKKREKSLHIYYSKYLPVTSNKSPQQSIQQTYPDNRSQLSH